MIYVQSSSVPVEYTVLESAVASLFDLAGGVRIYGMNAASRNIRVYLPPPTAGTTLIFMRIDAATSGYTCQVRGKSSAPILDDTSAVLSLTAQGHAVILFPSDDLSTWLPANRPGIVR